MCLNDATGYRERQPDATTLLMKRFRLAVVCCLYASVVGDDQHRRRPAVDLFDSALGNNGALAWLFSQKCSKNRAQRGPE